MGIQTARHGDVVELTLDWPAVRNALGPDEGRALRLALEAATGDPVNAVVVLSATGDAFCAGGNLAEIVELAKGGEEAVRTTIYGEFQGVFRAIALSPIPILTAVDGPAVGFGCDLALAGQATFVGPRGWIAQGWAKAGLIPATGGTLYVGRRGGPQAIWRLLAADRVDGPTAEAWGLAIACDDARAAALAMAARLAALPRAAVRATVELARIIDAEAHLATALDHQTGLITDPSFATRAAALLRPRNPR
jgi:enoyl-CoA hydratase/carnithine racemase